ncbi:MAG: hypothetical protein BWZ07_02803 [Alphaproteobacteria bacterium ADurb.BinA280]|nr:MAG: hypothetical protein BWZ07_02803 [Alphaproteobacteria bacterium ADurb.BinA280]
MCRQKKLCTKWLDVGRGGCAIGERSTDDLQAVFFNGVEYSQSRICRVAREQNHFDFRQVGAPVGVQCQQFLHQREGNPRLQGFVFALALEIGVGGQSLAFKQVVTVFQIEQGARGDRDDQAGGLGFLAHVALRAGLRFTMP